MVTRHVVGTEMGEYTVHWSCPPNLIVVSLPNPTGPGDVFIEAFGYPLVGGMSRINCPLLTFQLRARKIRLEVTFAPEVGTKKKWVCISSGRVGSGYEKNN